ncbi:uncharacterized protein LOC129286454 [Prosopis cineraria]|uniref:uncharacterized protein LOC129286454 n=1 Tax=Prosopis cineraria TaxID=364024 RepID=UPI00240F9ABE|nr:uncharacterized protein LOC129286454 [Prosopis cineraria]
MEPPEHRHWVYNRVDERGKHIDEFLYGVEEFIRFAGKGDEGRKIRCPCVSCRNLKQHIPYDVRKHLYRKGFTKDYYYWHCHGEERPQVAPINVNICMTSNPYEQMVIDAAGPSFNEHSVFEEDPNPNSAKFYDILHASQSSLWDGCENHIVLSVAVRLLSIKSDYNVPSACVDEIITLINEILTANHRMPTNLYQTKKLIGQLGCGYQKIDCCVKGCILYYGDAIKDKSCRFCKEPRFKEERVRKGRINKEIPAKQMWYLPLVPRLQRLFSSNATAKYMSWHIDKHHEEGVLSHPSDGSSWKHFDQAYLEFASEPRNVRLGLCADGFNPFGLGSRPYSCWPVIVTPYNLPPGMYMRHEYMFLTIIILGPSNPKSRIDVFLQPLIDELKIL